MSFMRVEIVFFILIIHHNSAGIPVDFWNAGQKNGNTKKAIMQIYCHSPQKGPAISGQAHLNRFLSGRGKFLVTLTEKRQWPVLGSCSISQTPLGELSTQLCGMVLALWDTTYNYGFGHSIHSG